MTEFKSWREIKAWAEMHHFDRLAGRLQLNNDCWMSSGEFGRSQVQICDAMRFCDTEEERIKMAQDIEKDLGGDELLFVYEKKGEPSTTKNEI